MEITGTVKQVLPLESGAGKTGKTWQKQGFVITFKDNNYEKNLSLSAKTDNVIKKVQALRSGQDVTVSFNVESREWNGKWFTDATAWKIDSGAAQVNQREDLPF